MPRPLVCLTVAALLAPATVGAGDSGREEPLLPGLEERVTVERVQLDVTVLGPPQLASSLSRDDFEITLGGAAVSDFALDNLCAPVGVEPGKDASADARSAVLQPLQAVFSREKAEVDTGFAVLGEDKVLDPARPGVFVTAVCRGPKAAREMGVTRVLVGSHEVRLPDSAVDFGEEACVQLRDFVPPGTLGEGQFRYGLKVLRGEKLLQERWREFRVGTDGASSGTEQQRPGSAP